MPRLCQVLGQELILDTVAPQCNAGRGRSGMIVVVVVVVVVVVWRGNLCDGTV